MSVDSQNTFRVIVVGNSGVGKSALNMRLVENVFYSEHVPTLGVDFKYSTFSPDESGAPVPVRLAVWDSAGQETFLSITQQFIRGADAAFLCFDVTDRRSFTDATTAWKDRVSGEKGGAIAMVLVGCKCDLEGMRAISKSEAAAWAAEKHLPYFETSAKENQNVRQTFAFLAKTLFDQRASGAGGAGRGGGGGGGGAKGASGAGVAPIKLIPERVAGPGATQDAAGADGAAAAAGGGGRCSKC